MKDENIIWREMDTVSFLNEQKEQVVIEPCKMEYYVSLYAELKDKCNPKKYMSPCNKEKVDIANELYQELISLGKEGSLHPIMDKAVQKLGITISTRRLYEKLLKYCYPNSFMDSYDFDTIQIANYYYSLVEEYRNDICELERLEEAIYKNDLLKNHQLKNHLGNNRSGLTLTEGLALFYILVAAFFLICFCFV